MLTPSIKRDAYAIIVTPSHSHSNHLHYTLNFPTPLAPPDCLAALRILGWQDIPHALPPPTSTFLWVSLFVWVVAIAVDHVVVVVVVVAAVGVGVIVNVDVGIDVDVIMFC